MDQNVKISADKNDLKEVAEARLRDFSILKRSKQYSGAVYMGRFVVEVFLKCLICKKIGQAKLHKVFHSHDLEFLLFFTGLEKQLRTTANEKRLASFMKINAHTVDDLRYRNPQKVTESDCNDWNRWLNDENEGVVPWLRKKLK